MRKFVLLAFILIALVATLSVGCVSKTVPKSTQQKNMNPLDALTKLFSTLGKVKSYRAKTTVTGLEGLDPAASPYEEMTMEFVAPDRIHFVGKQLESYMIGETIYMKMNGIAGNQWQKSEIPESASISIDYSLYDPKKMQANLEASTEKRFIGPKVLDGKPMLVYEYKGSKIIDGKTVATSSKVWIGVADNLLYRVETTVKIDAMNIESVTTYYDYNANITIDPPIQ